MNPPRVWRSNVRLSGILAHWRLRVPLYWQITAPRKGPRNDKHKWPLVALHRSMETPRTWPRNPVQVNTQVTTQANAGHNVGGDESSSSSSNVNANETAGANSSCQNERMVNMVVKAQSLQHSAWEAEKTFGPLDPEI